MNDTNNINNGFSAEDIKLTAHALTENLGKPIDTEQFYIEITKAKESS